MSGFLKPSLLLLGVFCALAFAQTDVPVEKKTTTKPTTSTTTTVAPPNVTTSAPITTEKPTPTPQPTPVPTPDVNIWSANYTNTNFTCLVFQAALQYEVRLPGANDTIKINVPKTAVAKGDCGLENATSESLNITWGDNTVVVTLNKNNSKYEIANLVANLTIQEGINDTVTLISSLAEPEFEVSSKNSYKCAKLQTLNFTTEEPKNATVVLHVSSFQYQAFRHEKSKVFSAAWDCEGSTSDVVPIVVGCVLAVSVVIILLAYLFGRRRCQARGYLSM